MSQPAGGLATAPTSAPSTVSLWAVAWMASAILFFGAMAIAGRELSAELDTFEIMAYRSAIGLPFIVAAVWYHGDWRTLATDQPREHVVRNVIHFAGQNFWFYGVAVLPLAQLVALEFTSPIWVILLAPLLLGERLTRPGIIAAALGFLGMLVVARPGFSPIEAGHGAALAAALGFALTNIMTKRLSRRDGTLCILFWMTLSQLLMGLLCAAPGGITLVSWALVPWTLFVGICGLMAHLSLTRALTLAPAIIVAPMEFMRLPAIAVAGMLLYGEPLEVAVFVGGALILAGNIVNIRARSAA
ncbi:MAG: DMT family transporter [Pseudomonadota bacterium]